MFIDTPQNLQVFCQSLRQSLFDTTKNNRYLALDSEFIRDKTYYPQLCLLQIAHQDNAACIDPQALNQDQLAPLLELLYDSSITKILHSAQQDLEIFFHWQGEIPAPLFDTQIAAALSGFGEQIGYAALVKNITGIELDKSQTRTNWSIRPLSAKQIEYAMADVQYLPAIYQHQLKQLQAEQKLDLLAGDFTTLADPQRYRPAPEQSWQRIKGHGRLHGVQLAVLRALAAWREQQAMQQDKPRRWIIGDDILLDIARRLPKTETELKKIRSYRENAKTSAETLISLIDTARQEPPEQWPTIKQYQPLTAQQEILMEALTLIIHLRATQANLNPEGLIGRKDLEKLVQSDATDALPLHGWRAALIGHDLKAFLNGSRRISVRDGELCIED